MKPLYLVLVIALTCLTSCNQAPSSPIKIGINPWPGYEFLYLAEKQGFFKEVGANVQLIQLGTLTDVERAYINGRVDGIASTLIEVVQSHVLSPNPLEIVMIPDYSNGGDVIVANKSIENMKQLNGKSVGTEVSSLGIFVLERALAKAGLNLSDVNIVNTAQTDGKSLLELGKIDAFVSYPPYSLEVLRNEQYHQIFTSAEIPYEIIDSVAIATSVLKSNPGIDEKLLQAWDKALAYAKENPQHAYQIMAEREGITAEEFEATLGDLIILDADQQRKLLSNPESLKNSLRQVCTTLVQVNAIEAACSGLESLIHRSTQ